MANQQLPIDQQEEDDSTFFDLLAAPFRGIEGAVQGVYNLADYLTFDALPDYDTKFLGKSKTVAGGAVEGITQFVTGFVPIFGWAGRAGNLAKAGSLTQKALSGTVSRGAIAGAVTDFTMFNGQEARLSNLIESVPELQNPVTQFLSHDDEEGEIEGRLKNVLEGLGLEAVAFGFIKGLKAMKKGRQARAENADPDSVYSAMDLEMGDMAKDLPILPVGEARKQLKKAEDELAELLEGPDWQGDIGGGVSPKAVELQEKVAAAEARVQEAKAARIRQAEPQNADEIIARIDELDDGVDVNVSFAGEDKLILQDILDARPPRQPYKTNLEAKRGLEGSRGPDYLKKRLLKKFPIKGADEAEAKDVIEFIETIGGRMFDDVSLSVVSNFSAAGRFDFASKLVTIRKQTIEAGNLSRTAIHELWHAASRYLPSADVKRLTSQFTKARKKFMADLSKKAKNEKLTHKQRLAAAKELSDFKKGDYTTANYRFSELDEFFTEEMTDAFFRHLDAKDALAAPGTFKRVAQEIAILLKDMFASMKSKLGIDQRQKIFNDFLKQRNVKKQRSGPLDWRTGKGTTKALPNLGDIDPKHKEFAEAVVKGAEVVPPRMETTDGIHSLTAALRAEVTKDPATMAKLDQEAAEGLPTDFGDNVITDRFKGMENTIENQRQVRLEATVYKRIGEGLVRNLVTAGDKYRQSGGGTVAVAELKNTLQELVEFSNYYWRLGRESSLALGVRRNKEPSRKIGLNEADMTSEGIRKNFINENGGMDPDKIMKIIDETVDPNDLQGSLNGIMGLARKTQGSRLLDMPREYWINSILSGPRTQVVNVMGNALAGVWSTLETAVGGVLSGNLEVTKQAFASWADMTMYKEAFKFARNTLKTAENTLDPDARAFGEGPQNAITAEAFGVKEGQRGHDSINGLGDFIRIPSRLLMTTDEFFKQLHYRRSARLKLAMDGLGQGIQDPYKLAEHIEKGLESIVTDSGRYMSEESLIREGTEIADGQGLKGQEKADFIINYKNEKFNEDASGLANYAVDEARYMTFTKELEEGTLARGIQNLSQKHNLVGFILPFVRTPTNLLKFAFERTPGVLMLPTEVKKLWKDHKGSDPILKAQARGKMATSAIAGAVLLDLALNNREFLTGGGPKDHKQKKALQATGWQPYSFKIDGKYYSYQRLDPFGTLLGVMADLVETGIKSPKGFNDSAIDQVFSAVAVTFTRNVTNKSYLAGLQMFTEAASNPERYGDRLLRNFGSSMLPYSGFLNQIQYGTGDQESREVRTLADALLNKIPSGRDNLDPKRNLLGEEIMVENLPLIGAINPIATSTEKNDVILNEMASLNHAFREPPSTYHNLIDLLAFENDSGQTAHDRRLEKLKTIRIGGRTLRQSLERLIRSRAYQKLSATSEPGFPSPRIQKINSILTKYRSEALDDTMREFPELSGYYDQVTRAKKQFRMGADFTDVLSLLQQ
mgnify:CR=1 FL=1